MIIKKDTVSPIFTGGNRNPSYFVCQVCGKRWEPDDESIPDACPNNCKFDYFAGRMTLATNPSMDCFHVEYYEGREATFGYRRDAQYDSAPFVTYKRKRKRNSHCLNSGFQPWFFLLEGWGHPKLSREEVGPYIRNHRESVLADFRTPFMWPFHLLGSNLAGWGAFDEDFVSIGQIEQDGKDQFSGIVNDRTIGVFPTKEEALEGIVGWSKRNEN